MLAFIWTCVCGHLMDRSLIFTLFSSAFGLLQLPREIFGSLVAKLEVLKVFMTDCLLREPAYDWATQENPGTCCRICDLSHNGVHY